VTTELPLGADAEADEECDQDAQREVDLAV
jgi:hypothetical protein